MAPQDNPRQPSLQFGLRHVFLWTGALAGAFALGRIKENYEPVIGDLGGLAILLAIVVIGAVSGALTGQALLRRGGRVVGAILGVILIFAAFILFVSLE